MSFDLQPYLENDLLVLRPLSENDFESMYKVASNPLIWEQHFEILILLFFKKYERLSRRPSQPNQ